MRSDNSNKGPFECVDDVEDEASSLSSDEEDEHIESIELSPMDDESLLSSSPSSLITQLVFPSLSPPMILFTSIPRKKLGAL